MTPGDNGTVSSADPELVNPVPVEEVEAWARSMRVAFLQDREGPEMDRTIDVLRRSWNPERAWGARDAGRWVATLRTEERRLTVPQGARRTAELTVDALTNVTVAGTHRRLGLMSRMLERSLAAARERGDPVSVLIAAEWPIYGRFGYAPAIQSAAYVLHRRWPGAACPGDPRRVSQVERDEFGDAAPAVFDAARRLHAGQMNRDRGWWNRVLGRDGYAPLDSAPHNWFVHLGDDGPDGLVAWSATGPQSLAAPAQTLHVWQLTSANDLAYRDLWSYLSGIDGADRVMLPNRPVNEPVRWLLHDGRALAMTEQIDFLWLRVLDVPATLSARRYAIPGELVLEIVDEDAGRFCAGRYLLTADGEEVECRRVDRGADLQLTQRALASIYLGAFRLAELPSEVVAELTPGALARADLMFSTPLPPWNATWF